MPDQLDFNHATTERLEKAYLGADIARRRKLVSHAVAPAPGERILDVGCGPGFYVAEFAGVVGGDGHVTGVDVSEDMLEAAARRTAEHENVTLLIGDAKGLPVPDGSFDAALSVQVYEYVDDTPAALAEMHRALGPGGRLVLWDVDWSTVSWFSTDADRMARVLRAWEAHLIHHALPRRLSAQMRSAGFVDVEVEAHAFVNTDSGPDAYGGLLIPLIEDFVSSHGVTVEEAAQWRAELEDLNGTDEYFFAITQFCFSATKTG